MNKNKLIFLVLLWWLVFIILLIAIVANKDKGNPTKTNSESFNIWIVWDDKSKFSNIITEFKSLYTGYKTKDIVIESFWDYQEYFLALSSAIANDEAPDIFVMNNNEKETIFDWQVMWLDPEIFSPIDFRKKYENVFSDDLIFTWQDWEQEKEALKWIPVWYETLWIFYNGRYVNSRDLEYLASLNAKISELKESSPNYTPIWIWNWSTVFDSADIVTQFFMLEDNVVWVENVSWNILKEALWTYLYYWDISSDNSYNSEFSELKKLWNNNLDLFCKWEIYMVVWYPRMIEQIDEKWYSTSLLRVASFPHYLSGQWNTLVNYNYFVINKNTNDLDFANTFLSYLATDNWAKSYLSNYTYYLPALLSLKSDKLESKVDEDYKVYLWDFYNNDYVLSSFDKWMKTLYDQGIISILDNSTNYESEFINFRDKLMCRAKKVINLENLSRDCE